MACSMRKDSIDELEKRMGMNLTYFLINMMTPPFPHRSNSQVPVPAPESSEPAPISVPIVCMETLGFHHTPAPEDMTEPRFGNMSRMDSGDEQVPGGVSNKNFPNLENLDITDNAQPHLALSH